MPNGTISPHPIGRSKVKLAGRKMAGEDQEVIRNHRNFEKLLLSALPQEVSIRIQSELH
jgi:hypothetical protein